MMWRAVLRSSRYALVGLEREKERKKTKVRKKQERKIKGNKREKERNKRRLNKRSKGIGKLAQTAQSRAYYVHIFIADSKEDS